MGRTIRWFTDSRAAKRGAGISAEKIQVEVLEAEGTRPCPLAWLDSFCMRSFAGRSAFDKTLPLADGLLEVGFQVDLEALGIELEDWLKRKFGGGKRVELRLNDVSMPAVAPQG